MDRYTLRMLWRSIRSTLGRYLAITAIVALGVGFFAGLKSACPAMQSTADQYLRRQHFEDFRLLSSLGFSPSDPSAFQALEGVEAAEGGYFADAWLDAGAGAEVYHLLSLPEKVDLPELTAGRLPETDRECLADSRAFSAAALGRTLTLTEDNDEDTRELLPGESYTIVGLCRSPRYISQDRGSTSLGAGQIRGFLYLPPSAFHSEAYHELTLWCGLPGELYSEEYEAARDRLADSVETLLNRRGRLRQRILRADADRELAEARSELDQGWQDYEEGKAQAEKELADALKTLNDSQGQLLDSQRQVDAGRAELEAGMAAIPEGRSRIAGQRSELEGQRAQLAQARAQAESAIAELNTQAAAIEAGAARLQAEKDAVLSPILAQIQALEEQLAALPEDDESRPQLQAALDGARAGLQQAEGAFAPREAELQAARDALNQGLSQAQAGLQEIQAGEAALADGQRQLDAAEQQLSQAEADYPANREALDRAQAEIDAGWWQYEKGVKEYEKARQEAESELQDALRELEDAEGELQDARQEAAEQLRLELYTLDRDANPGYVTFESDVRIIDGLADAFPLFFALVAALVCVTTMTRMVGEERTLIGTLKALGYSAGGAMAKYLLYAGTAALLGGVAGFFLGTAAIPACVWVAYGIVYDYARLRFYFDPVLYGLSLAVSVPGALLVTALACRRELREKPAELIRPRAPKAGRRLLLERFTPLWRRLPFLSKLSLRNAFRYPARVLMLLLGIGGCTALMVAGFGAKDSVARISDYQYGEIFLYDLAVSLDTEDLPSDAERLWQGETEAAVLTRQETVTLRAGQREKSTRLIAAREDLGGLIDLHDDRGPLPFPGKGEAVITEKIAESLSLRPGDALTLVTDGGESVSLTVSGVCKNYLNHYLFCRTDSLDDKPLNCALLRCAPETDSSRLGARLRGEEGVSYVTETARERETMERSMASLDLMVLLLIVCSGALAFITLYNLTNINILERIREIATVKVLGFFPRETADYVLRENLLLAFLGAVLGLWLGKGLHLLVVRSIVVDAMTYEIRIAPLSYALAFAITLCFTVLTNLFMGRKLEGVNMAESLKAVE